MARPAYPANAARSTHSAQRATSARLLLALSLALLLVLLSAPHALAQVIVQQSGEARLSTKYFTIYYPVGEEVTAQWYASFADDVDATVSELLGSPPIEGLTLHIYTTEAQYLEANPLAESHPGILAHAIPEKKEIGVAVERLRTQPQDLARQSFRHEITHIVAGDLSGHNLPIAFQEGLAQYNELSSARAEDVVKVLSFAQSRARRLLTWSRENDRVTFQTRLDLAYPESYTIMAFLADKYGMGAFSRFLKELKSGKDWTVAMESAYGKSSDELEQEWRDYLPDFFNDGYKQNILTYYDIGSGIALYDAARYQDAEEYFAHSESLYNDLGKQDKAAAAADYRFKAGRAGNAVDLAGNAATALETHDYARAQMYASQANDIFTQLKIDNQKEYVGGLLDMSTKGLEARGTLQQAESGVHITDFLQAQTDARRAGETLAALGDTKGVEQANGVLNELWAMQRAAGVLALVFGAFIVTIGVITSVRVRASKSARAQFRVEEGPSWL